MYEIVKSKGVEAAIEWFKAKGKKAGWGGSNSTLAKQLLKDGRVDDALRLLEFDVESAPGKVWLLRKTAQTCLENGRPKKALVFVNMGLKLRPDDERFITLRAEAQQHLKEP